jgi:hypothetical protein
VATTKNRADKAAVEPIVPAKRPLGESTVQSPAAAAEDEVPDVPAPKAKSKESLKKINSIFAAKPSSSGKSADNAAAPVVEQDEDQPAEKKKKRKLGGLGGKPAFVWDQAQVREIIPAHHRHCQKKTDQTVCDGAEPGRTDSVLPVTNEEVVHRVDPTRRIRCWQQEAVP